MKNINKKLVIILLAALWCVIAFSKASAAEAPSYSLVVTPQLPYAGNLATVEIIPQNFPVASTTFYWTRDNVRLNSSSGLGRSVLNVATSPGKTEIIRIEVNIDPGPDFNRVSDSAVIYTIPSPGDQQEALDTIKSGFTLEASNTNPDPGEVVNVGVSSFAFDKQNATYRWQINGVYDRSLGGRGQYQIALAAGKEGETKTVRVEVVTPEGVTRAESLVIRTMSAPVYWWAATAVPYWYKGKALPTLNSQVTVMAIPGKAAVSSVNYRWQFNSAVATKSSGFGKQTFSFPLNFSAEEQIDVEMKNNSGTLNKKASLVIKPLAPSVNVYEILPLKGVSRAKALDIFSAQSGGSYDFIASPFFFPESRLVGLNYRWSLNSEEIVGTFSKPWLFTLKTNGGESSSDQVGIRVTDAERQGAEARASFQANFN